MTIDHFREYCLSFKGTTEDLAFDENTLVFKVPGRMFLLTNLENFEYCNLKCNPEKALELREKFMQVTPAWQMNKKHWNSVIFTGDLIGKKIEDWITDSYNLVVEKIPKKLKTQL